MNSDTIVGYETHRLPEALNWLPEAYDEFLFREEVKERLAHHLALVAPETWLAMELAYLINCKVPSTGEAAWTAVLERKRVDMTLVPPGTAADAPLPDNAVYLELKLVSTGYWNPAWSQVRDDLQGGDRKPRANFAICFLMNHLAPGISKRRDKTAKQRRDLLSRVPSAPRSFEPVEPVSGRGQLQVLWSGEVHHVEWRHAVYGKWPEGYSTDVRIVWVREATQQAFFTTF